MLNYNHHTTTGGGRMENCKVINSDNIASVRYKYMYQNEKHLRSTHIYERAEVVSVDKEDILNFSAFMNSKVGIKRLKRYIDSYYLEPAEDGQVNVDYMIARCERHYGQDEMLRSWNRRGLSL